MNLHEERIKIFEKHIFQMKMVNRSYYISSDVPDDMLTNAIRKYAPDFDKKL